MRPHAYYPAGNKCTDTNREPYCYNRFHNPIFWNRGFYIMIQEAMFRKNLPKTKNSDATSVPTAARSTPGKRGICGVRENSKAPSLVYSTVRAVSCTYRTKAPLSLLSGVHCVLRRDHRLQLQMQALPEPDAFPGFFRKMLTWGCSAPPSLFGRLENGRVPVGPLWI